MSSVAITSQGQITVPAAVRRRWGIEGAARVNIEFDENTEALVITRRPSIEEVLARIDAVPRDTTIPPLVDPSEYYERERARQIGEKLS